jgi:predicted RNA-binding Zn ribbon-like protein
MSTDTEAILADITARFQAKEAVLAVAKKATHTASIAATVYTRAVKAKAEKADELREAARNANKALKIAKEAAAEAAKAYTRFLNGHHERVSKELGMLYTPNSDEWWVAFRANPIIQSWQADFHYRMNASAGW